MWQGCNLLAFRQVSEDFLRRGPGPSYGFGGVPERYFSRTVATLLIRNMVQVLFWEIHGSGALLGIASP